MIIDIHDVWQSAATIHEYYVRAAIAQAWERLFRFGPPSSVLSRVRAFVENHATQIVSATTRDYRPIVADYNGQFPTTSSDRAEARSILEAVFNYEKFRDAKIGWNAYELCAASPYTVCPYCHLAPTNTVLKSNEHQGYRPQLDHFIGRAEYPFLSLSLGNLVPSCPTCNGPTMKHTTDVLVNPHLFPLADPSVLSFKLRPKNGKPWTPPLRALRMPRHEYEIVVDAPHGNTAAENSLKTFQLRSRYQPYLHDAFRLAKASKDGAFLRTIKKVFNWDVSLEDHLGFPINGNPTAFKNIPQGKMRLDVYTDCRQW